MPPLFLIIIVCIDSWVTGEFILFSSKLLLSLWPMVSVTILGVTIVTLGTTPVISRACMLIYGPAWLCMCLQASVHSCSAGPFFFGITSLWLQSKVKLILTIILQKQLQLCNCQLTLCVHPSKHAPLSACACMRLWNVSACICMYIILCVVHSQR